MGKYYMELISMTVILNILRTTSIPAITAQYTYDNLNRLIEVRYEDGTIIHYTYEDASDRRLPMGKAI
ncbi:MAG: hypothetical protein AB1424_01640 [Thermodesulfobacteriota bacterium]